MSGCARTEIIVVAQSKKDTKASAHLEFVQQKSTNWNRNLSVFMTWTWSVTATYKELENQPAITIKQRNKGFLSKQDTETLVQAFISRL